MIKKNLLIFTVLAGLSPAAFAFDTDYVVMGGFETIVNAFTRLKLIFNDNQYTMLISAFVFMGVAAALLTKSAKNGIEYLETGKAQMGMGWLAMAVMGTLFYVGLVQPKGTVYIYDQSRNQYQAVSGIPDFITVTARLTNSVYQAFVDFSNRDTASTVRFTGEGMAIKMLMNVVSRNGAPFDPYLTDNVKALWRQCEPIAESRGFDPRTVRSGANALDVVTALSPLRNQAAYTVWYSSSNPGGATVTCDQSYTSLKGALGDPSAYDARLRDICVKSGYAVSDSSQYVDCKNRLESSIQTIFGASTLSLNSIMSNVLVSQGITDALIENNPEVAASMVANRSMMNSGLADAMTNPEWMSTIMAAVLAIILAITPMLLLLVFTPLMTKALTLLFGLWVFITTWQIADVMLLQASTDEILTVMNEVKNYGLGIDSMQLAPTAAMKAMSVMGSARTSAVQIATLVAGIFGVSAFGLSAFGQRALSNLDRISNEVGDKTLTPEGRGHLINDISGGIATQQVLNTAGIDAMSNTSMLGQMKDISASSAQIQGLGNGSVETAAQRIGQVQGGRQVGEVSGYETASPNMSGAESAAIASRTSAQHETGNALGQIESAGAANLSVGEQARVTSSASGVMQTADAQSNIANAGGNLANLHKQQKQVHGTERQTEIGTSVGTQQAANAAGLSVTDMTAKKTSVNQSSDLGHSQGILDAAGGSLANVQSRESYVASTGSAESKGHADSLHNAFGGNGGIESGVAAMQTEQTKQHAVDMQRQADLVNTLQQHDENGVPLKTESEARRDLSDANGAQTAGALRAHNGDGKAVEDTAAYDATKHLAQNTGEQKALAENGIETKQHFERGGEISTERGIAGQSQFNELSKPLGGDQQLAAAETGSGVHLAVNAAQAKALKESGLIDTKQAASVPDEGAAKVDLALARNANGELASTGSVHSGHSTSKDNSSKDDSSYSVNKGIDTGGDNSGRTVLQDPESVLGLIKQSNANRPGSAPEVLANEAARNMSSIRSASNEGNTSTSISGGVNAGKGGAGGLFGASAGANASHTDTDTERTNAMYGAYLNEAQAMQAAGLREANALGLQGNAKQNYVDDYTAREFANYYGQNLRTANSDSMESGLSTRQNKFNESWNEKNNINDRPTAPVIPTNEKGETQMISAQEYLWRQQQNGAIRTASEQVTEQVSQERAGPSASESRAPEYTPPNVQTIVRVKKSDAGEGESTELSSQDDTGAHPPVNAGTASAGIPIAGSSKDNPKAPK